MTPLHLIQCKTVRHIYTIHITWYGMHFKWWFFLAIRIIVFVMETRSSKFFEWLLDKLKIELPKRTSQLCNKNADNCAANHIFPVHSWMLYMYMHTSILISLLSFRCCKFYFFRLFTIHLSLVWCVCDVVWCSHFVQRKTRKTTRSH